MGWKVALVTFCLVVLVCFGMAREWSDQVQMTHAGEYRLDGRYFQVAVDSHDDVHLVYGYLRYDNDVLARNQPVYQKFNRFGEPLTEPVVIGIEAELPDSELIKAFDIFIDRSNEDQVYVLWGYKTLHFTKLNCDGEIVVPEVHLEGITIVSTDLTSRPPQMVVSSDEDVYILADAIRIGDPLFREFVSYGHYTPQGDLIDTLHTLQAAVNYVKRPQLQIESDTLYAVWMHYLVEKDYYENHFSKITSDNEIVVDNVILSIDEDRSLTSNVNFGIDSENGLVFSGTRNGIYFLARFNRQLDLDWLTDDIGRNELGDRPGDLIIDEDGNIHVIDDINDDNFNDGRICIAYSEFDEDGNIVDSLQFIHDHFQREVNRAAQWSVMRMFLCGDGTAGVIWDDDRYYDEDNGRELFMRFSSPDNEVDTKQRLPVETSLISSFPNPFNNSTTISFSAPNPGRYALSITDATGRRLFSDSYDIPAPETVSFVWNGLSQSGSPLPNGSYFVRVAGVNGEREIRVVFVK